MSKRLIRISIKSLAVLLLAVMTVGFVVAASRVEVAFKLYIDGEYIGVVDGVDTVNEAAEALASDIGGIAYMPELAGCTVTYGSAVGSEAKNKLAKDDVYKALYIANLKDYSAAYGVYANGVFVGANEDAEAVYEAVSSARRTAQGEDGSEVELIGSIEIKTLYYPYTALQSGVEIENSLTAVSYSLFREVPAEKSLVTVDVDVWDDEGPFLAPAGSEIVSTDISEDGKTAVTVRAESKIAYSIEYEKTTDLFVGEYEKKRDGEDGLKETVSCIIYENGVAVSTEIISETVLKEPTSKVIYEGTKVKPLTASTGIYDWPIKDRYTITDTYGYRYIDGSRKFHYAVDLATSSGIPIYAADGGVVTYAGRTPSYGYHVIIRHDNGQETLYAHMRVAPCVKEGERVYQGQQIGEVGMTGYATGPHLHFEIRINGERVDPLDYLP